MIRTFAAAAVALLAALTVSVSFAAPAGAAAPTIRLAHAAVNTYGPETPVYESCETFYPPLSDCGYVDLRLTFSGFDAFGGVAECDERSLPDGEGCSISGLGSIGDTGTASMHALVTCGTSTRTHLVKRKLEIHAADPYSDVNSYTRDDSNSATLVASFEFPTPAEYGVCGTKPTNLVRAKVFGMSVGFEGAAGTASRNYRIPGIFTYTA